MRLIEYSKGNLLGQSYPHVEPGRSEYAVEAWERQTLGWDNPKFPHTPHYSYIRWAHNTVPGIEGPAQVYLTWLTFSIGERTNDPEAHHGSLPS